MKVDFSGVEIPEDKRTVFQQLLSSSWTSEHLRKVVVNVKAFDETGRRHKYSVSLEAMTDYGQINVDVSHWNFETCLRKTIDRLDKQIRRRKGKITDRKGKKSWRQRFWPRFRK